MESVLTFAKQNELSAEKLVNLCKKISIVQSNSNVAIEELEEYCADLERKKNQKFCFLRMNQSLIQKKMFLVTSILLTF